MEFTDALADDPGPLTTDRRACPEKRTNSGVQSVASSHQEHACQLARATYKTFETNISICVRSHESKIYNGHLSCKTI